MLNNVQNLAKARRFVVSLYNHAENRIYDFGPYRETGALKLYSILVKLKRHCVLWNANTLNIMNQNGGRV